MPTLAHPAVSDSAPWYRHRWPWLLMVGPAWVLAAGAATGYLAYSRPDAMVVDDYYRQGKAINQDLRRDRAAASRAIAVDLVYQAGTQRLSATVTAGGRPLPGLVHLRLVHPTQPEKDLRLDLLAGADGSITVPLAAPEATRWGVQVEGGPGDWRLAGTWVKPATAPQLQLRAQ
ncbi:MAG: hypothetical protein JWP59_4589 [Massilia sp.]|nr:hypothetical protein [Massilia sp.]